MPQNRPNIIFIITDQQRYDTIAALGFPHMETPNLDRLVHEGVSFSNCCCAAPVCGASRASLFTGYYPHTTGIMTNENLWRHSWIEQLSASGYRCVNVGKMHTYPYHTPLGFHERYVVENKDRYLAERYYFDEWDKALRARGYVKPQRESYRKLSDYRERMGAFEWELPEELHADFFVGDLACWWLRNYPKTEPLFLQVGFPGPHPPYDPIPRYAQPYLKKDLPLPEIRPEDIENQPPAFKELREHNSRIDHDSIVHLLNPTREQLLRVRAYYCANVTMIDEKIGQLLNTLEEQGYLENSVVVFTSDHGDCLGDHGHIQKWTMYDCIVRMPLIVWAPGHFAGGRQVDELIQQMDVGPALLDLAGLAPAPSMEAQSILPALRGEPFEGRPHVFTEQNRDSVFEGAAYMTMVRDRDWKLVHFLDETYGQLFDLANDPGEFDNLWNDPSAADKRGELLDALLNWRIRSGIHTKDWMCDYR